jgi:hypothetical protein
MHGGSQAGLHGIQDDAQPWYRTITRFCPRWQEWNHRIAFPHTTRQHLRISPERTFCVGSATIYCDHWPAGASSSGIRLRCAPFDGNNCTRVDCYAGMEDCESVGMEHWLCWGRRELCLRLRRMLAAVKAYCEPVRLDRRGSNLTLKSYKTCLVRPNTALDNMRS